MKWLSGLLQALLGAFFASILIALFQQPIADHFRTDRIDAWFEFGPWMARPNSNGQTPGDAVQAAGLSSYSGDMLQTESDPTFAKVTLTNKTRDVVRSLRMRFPSNVTPDAYLQGAEGKWAFYKDAGELKLPDMAPGEKRTLYLWNPFGFSPYLMDRTETYSSDGAFRMTFGWSQSESNPDRESWFDRFMEDWFWAIIVIIGALVMLVMGIIIAVWSGYVKELLGAEDFYFDERGRFLEDPKKFAPDFSKTKK